MALLLSMTAANAQVKVLDSSKLSSEMKTLQPSDFKVGGLKSVNTSSAQKAKAMAPAKKHAEEGLTSEQRYLGNSAALNIYTSVGLPGQKTSKVGAYLSPDMLKEYAGDRIIGMRFLISSSIGSTHVFIQNSTGYNENTGFFDTTDEVTSQDVAETVATPFDATEATWNVVKFDTPYTIPSTPNGIMFGMTYTQKSTVDANGNYTEDTMPFYIGAPGNTVGGLCFYGTFTFTDGSKGTGWAPLALSSTTMCDLTAQVIVERKGGFIEDIQLGSFVADKFVKRNSGFGFAVSCRNIGSNPISNYTFGLALDGKEFATTTPKDKELNESWTSLSMEDLKLPEGTTVGPHKFDVYVKSMNGGDPTGNLSNDTLYNIIRVYDESISAHQKQLVEQFTSQGCLNCPYGTNVLKQLSQNRDDIAWVGIHEKYGNTLEDEFIVDESAYIYTYSFASGQVGFPSASFNRYLLANSKYNPQYDLAMGIGYSDYASAANLFGQVIDLSNQYIPSFVTLHLTQNFDLPTNELNLTVTGTGLKNASKVLAGTTLTVYLTEDGLVAPQLHGQTTNQEYLHNNVLRMILSAPQGDQIKWDGDNFEMTYTVEIPEDYDFSQMHAIAFISNPFCAFDGNGNFLGFYANDFDDAWVSNCNMIDLQKGESTGISNTVTSENKTVVARYAADGTRISAPVKGVNIVKYSDGTTRSIIVK